MNDGPVFIGGLAFSGKTPLRIALSAHPRLELTRRTAMWTRYHGRFGDLAADGNLDRCLDAMLADPAIAALQPDRGQVRSTVRSGPATYERLFAAIHQQHAQRRGKPRWGDQMGMIERQARLVLTAYPTAQMIHMIRDPRTRYRAGGERHRQLPGKLGWETARWRYSADLAVRNLRRFPGRYHVVRYEELCTAPESALREVCAFLGETCTEDMAAALKGATLVDPTSAGRHDRPQRAVAAFVERYAAPQLRAHAYATTPASDRRELPTSFYLIDLPCNRAGLAAWRIANTAGRTTREVA
jgi:Sulfotransferase family